MKIEKTFKVNKLRLHKAFLEVEKANKKADKLEMPRMEIKITKEYTESKENADGTVSVTNFVEIEVSGEIPMIGGWEIIGKIEHEFEGNIIKAYQEVPVKYRTVPAICEHCNTDRGRKETVILKQGEELKQVGKNCLKDFTGANSPERALGWVNIVAEFDLEEKESWGMGGYEIGYVPEEFLSRVVLIAESNGYKSRSQAELEDGYTTVDFVKQSYSWDKDKTQRIEPTEEHIKKAKEIIEWVKALSERENLSDYLYNLSIMAKMPYLKYSDLGIFGSSYLAFQREKTEQIRREHSKPSEHIGSEGQRIELELTVERSIYFSEAMYPFTILVFRDSEGNNLKWKASGMKNFEVGDKVLLKGTIVGHEEYKGEKVTELKRCKAIENLS